MLMPSFHSSFPDAKAVRSALAAGAVAGLVVIAACTDAGTSSKSLTAPAGPRTATTSTGTQGHGNGLAATIQVCVDANSPAGTYKFRNSHWNDNHALSAGSYAGTNWVAGGFDPGDGGEGWAPNDGSRAFTPSAGDNSEYTVAVGACQTVLERTAYSAHYNGPDPVWGYGPDFQDDFQSLRVTYSTIPGTAQYDSTQCVTDVGVVDPQPTPCGNASQVVKAFANYDHGTKITFAFKSAPILTACTVGTGSSFYGVSNARTNAVFNESEVLTGFALNSGVLHAWYTDEHALTLGVDSVYINNKAPVVDQYFGVSNFPSIYTIEKMTDAGNATSATTAGVARNPLKVGRLNLNPIFSPDNIARPVDGAGRPLYPGIYLTDLTNLGTTSKAGDWQMGNDTPKIPTGVYGTWKGAILTVDNTKNPSVTTIVPRADPAKNHKIVGTGGLNPLPAAQDLGYSSDIQWTVSSLGLIAGHAYRAQVIVHDGDQNKTGGDVGQACINIQN